MSILARRVSSHEYSSVLRLWGFRTAMMFFTAKPNHAVIRRRSPETTLTSHVLAPSCAAKTSSQSRPTHTNSPQRSATATVLTHCRASSRERTDRLSDGEVPSPCNGLDSDLGIPPRSDGDCGETTLATRSSDMLEGPNRSPESGRASITLSEMITIPNESPRQELLTVPYLPATQCTLPLGSRSLVDPTGYARALDHRTEGRKAAQQATSRASALTSQPGSSAQDRRPSAQSRPESPDAGEELARRSVWVGHHPIRPGHRGRYAD